MLEDNKKNRFLEYAAPTAFTTSGVAIGYGTLYPWAHKNIDKKRYKRLAQLRKSGKHGFKIISPSITTDPKEQIRRKYGTREKIMTNVMWTELDPTELRELKDYKGVAYIQSGQYVDRPISPKIANWGNWDIGVDKLTTWDYLKNKGVSDLHVETLGAEQFYTPNKKRLSDTGQKFMNEAGGLENLVLKKRDSARGRGVWLNAAEVPDDIAEQMYKNPKEFLLQKKMDLAEEFRVVTVGDMPVHSTYRFGSPTARKIAKKLGFESMKDVADKGSFKKSPFEIVQPIADKKLRNRLNEFATKASKELPYEIGALDIGLTKSGKFKIIEAQRQFGNISNPVVSRRIKNAITGKAGITGYVSMAIGAIAGYSLYSSLFKDNKDALSEFTSDAMKGTKFSAMPNENTMAARTRAQHTEFKAEFASRWDPMRKLAVEIFGQRGKISKELAYERMIKSSLFQKSLKEGKQIKKLGAGVSGEVHLYESTIAGRKFSYVKKTAFEGEEELLKKEVNALKDISGDIMPSAYGQQGNALYMEKMEGETLNKLLRSGEISKEFANSVVREQIEKQMGQVAAKGYGNPDVHFGNIMFDPKTQRTSWIDFGLAEKTDDSAEFLLKQMLDESAPRWKKGLDFFGGKVPEGIHPGTQNSIGASSLKSNSDFGSGWTGAVRSIVEKKTKPLKINTDDLFLNDFLNTSPIEELPKNYKDDFVDLKSFAPMAKELPDHPLQDIIDMNLSGGARGGKMMDPDSLGLPDGLQMNPPESGIMTTPRVYDISGIKYSTHAKMSIDLDDFSSSEKMIQKQTELLSQSGAVKITTRDNRTALDPKRLASKIHERL